MKKIRTIFAAILMFVTMSAPVLAPVAVHAADDPLGSVREGVKATCTGANCDDQTESGAKGQLGDVLKKIINFVSFIVGIIAVIMIIIGGLKYIVSGGESAGVTSAKNSILFAIVGLVVVLFAQIIVRVVVNSLG